MSCARREGLREDCACSCVGGADLRDNRRDIAGGALPPTYRPSRAACFSAGRKLCNFRRRGGFRRLAVLRGWGRA